VHQRNRRIRGTDPWPAPYQNGSGLHNNSLDYNAAEIVDSRRNQPLPQTRGLLFAPPYTKKERTLGDLHLPQMLLSFLNRTACNRTRPSRLACKGSSHASTDCASWHRSSFIILVKTTSRQAHIKSSIWNRFGEYYNNYGSQTPYTTSDTISEATPDLGDDLGHGLRRRSSSDVAATEIP